MRFILIKLVAVFIFSFSFSAQAKEVNISFKNWNVNCDIYNNCVASTDFGNTDMGVPAYIFSIARNDYQDYWEISFISNDAPPAKNISLIIDNEEINILSADEFMAFGKLNQYYFLGEKAQIVFDKLLPANTLVVKFSDEYDNDFDIDFSLSGLSASLLYIDEKQEMLGEKRIAGEAPRNKTIVTSREPEPVPQMILNEHQKPTISGCEPIDELTHGDDLQSYRLDATSTLYLVPCTAGAYNFSYIAYVKDEYETSMLSFASYYDGNGWGGTRYLINPYFNEKTNILADFYKGRGIGDCGTSGVWQWNEYSFKLLEYSAKAECGGEIDEDEDIGNFPIIYKDPNFKGFRSD